MTLTRSDFSYDLPEELIAQHPSPERDGSRLLVSDPTSISHKHFTDLPSLLPQHTLLVANNSQVIPTRIFGHLPTGGKVELALIRPTGDCDHSWLTLGRPMKKLQAGTRIYFEEHVSAVLLEEPSRAEVAPFKVAIEGCADVVSWLQSHGNVPLPPYIKRATTDPKDAIRYQTVYAKALGSAAAPTAGLHFNERIIQRLAEKNILWKEITLHVGAGTFMPVKTEDPSSHTMHVERFHIGSETWDAIQDAKAKGHKVLAVGTTTFRATESLQLSHPSSSDFDRWHETDLFIWPKTEDDRYKSQIFDGMITNFHQPESTLFMLICALIGYGRAKEVYETAIREKYRFFSYGDSSLLWF